MPAANAGRRSGNARRVFVLQPLRQRIRREEHGHACDERGKAQCPHPLARDGADAPDEEGVEEMVVRKAVARQEDERRVASEFGDGEDLVVAGRKEEERGAGDGADGDQGDGREGAGKRDWRALQRKAQ